MSAPRQTKRTSDLDALLCEGARCEIDASAPNLRARVLTRIEASDARAQRQPSPRAQRRPAPAVFRLGPAALAAGAAIVAGVAIRAAFLAMQTTQPAAPPAGAAAYLARSLSTMEQLVAERAPRQALAALERYIEQPLRSESRALLLDAQRALKDLGARSNPLRALPPLKQQQ